MDITPGEITSMAYMRQVAMNKKIEAELIAVALYQPTNPMSMMAATNPMMI